jgi:hypothetical protein
VFLLERVPGGPPGARRQDGAAAVAVHLADEPVAVGHEDADAIIEHDWHYHEAGEDATRIEVAMTSVEVDPWLGRKLDRFVMARQLEKGLRRSLDNIGDLVARSAGSEELARRPQRSAARRSRAARNDRRAATSSP